MEVVTETINGVLVAMPEGRLDRANASEFESALGLAMADRECPVVVDCERLSYISSAGLYAILNIARSNGERGQPFAVCSLSAPIADVFHIGGFDRIIIVNASLEEALDGIGD